MIPAISENDFQTLEKVLERKQSHYKTFLKGLMKKFRKVKDHEVSKKTIRLNSVVELWHSLLQKVIKVKIVLPSQENLMTKNISFFSPMGIAMIGYTENDLITISGPVLNKELRILRVTNV